MIEAMQADECEAAASVLRFFYSMHFDFKEGECCSDNLHLPRFRLRLHLPDFEFHKTNIC